MKNWCSQPTDLKSFSIAADARFDSTSYTNDHIWSLHLTGGEPSALAIYTSFGLRAKNFRLFPRFIEGDASYIDPTSFFKSPKLSKYLPNYIEVFFSPIQGIDVTSEYWVPSSNILAGRITIVNSRLGQRKIDLQLATLLNPHQGGQGMSPLNQNAKCFLYGRSANLVPVLYLTGIPEVGSGPYPSLSIALDLEPGDSRQYKWTLATTDDLEKSLTLATTFIDNQWDAEIAKIEVMNEGQLTITTADPEWDAIIAFSQKKAIQMLMGPSELIPKKSYVLAREPEQGYSALGDGSDYSILWNGQTLLDTDYLSTFLLPMYPDLVTDFITNFLDSQAEDGFINYKIGPDGHDKHMLGTPILVNLVWRLYQVNEDVEFLGKAYPKLLKFIKSWFTVDQDRDGDGLPEWGHPIQTGYDDNPIFSQLNPLTVGADITKTETPSLCAFLYNEIIILQKIAGLVKQEEDIPSLETYARKIGSALDASWDQKSALYRYWDRESHFCTKGERIGQSNGPGEIPINKHFDPPVRLMIKIKFQEELRNDLKIFIHGVGLSKNQKIERIETNKLPFHLNWVYTTSESLYTFIDYIDIRGTDNRNLITVDVMDLSSIDQTLLLPMWAKIPDEDRARNMVEKGITNPSHFWRPYGISDRTTHNGDENKSSGMVHMIWNNLIGEGLISYGFREVAADLVDRLMKVAILNLKRYDSLFSLYDANSGKGFGDCNSLRGLPPVHLFLETLGVRIISSKKVIVQGKNPFPWPVTINYKGMTVVREFNKTTISFSDGQTATIKSEEPRVIQMESN